MPQRAHERPRDGTPEQAAVDGVVAPDPARPIGEQTIVISNLADLSAEMAAPAAAGTALSGAIAGAIVVESAQAVPDADFEAVVEHASHSPAVILVVVEGGTPVQFGAGVLYVDPSWLRERIGG